MRLAQRAGCRETMERHQFATLMKPLLIVLAGHAPEAIRTRLGDFDDWFRAALGVPAADTRTLDASAGERPPAMDTIGGAVISGSAAMVTDKLTWSEQLAGWIRAATKAGMPLFGVCYGHQLMAHALGGRAGELDGGRVMGTVEVEMHSAAAHDRLFKDLPTYFAAQATHVQSVLEPPPGTQVLGRTTRDPYQILRYGPRAISTQLHPEFDAEIMRAYLRLRAEPLRDEGLDVDALLGAVRETPHARGLLARFARLVRGDEAGEPYRLSGTA
jgi:GMP synthase (glutamine-hydrolysing)